MLCETTQECRQSGSQLSGVLDLAGVCVVVAIGDHAELAIMEMFRRWKHAIQGHLARRSARAQLTVMARSYWRPAEPKPPNGQTRRAGASEPP